MEEILRVRVDTCPPLQDLGSRDKIRDSRIRINFNVFREKSLTLLSSFPLCNLAEHSRSSLGGLLFISLVSWQVWLCLSWLGGGSGL